MHAWWQEENAILHALSSLLAAVNRMIIIHSGSKDATKGLKLQANETLNCIKYCSPLHATIIGALQSAIK